MRVRAVLLVAAVAVGLVACGSGPEVGSESSTTSSAHTTKVPTTALADVTDSGYLRKVVANELRGSATAPTKSGLLVVGGYAETYEAPIEPVGDAVIVHTDGTVTVLPPPPGVPLASVSASAYGDTAHLVGTRCTTGTLIDDTSALSCEPGTPALFRFNLKSSEWTELARPKRAPAPGGFLGDQAIYALDGTIVYQVINDTGPDGRLASWISDDEGKTWKAMPTEPAGAYCAADGKLLSVRSDDHPPEPGGNGVIQMTDTPDSSLAVTVRTFDTGTMKWGPISTAPDDFPVVGGATSVSCVPDVGAAAFTLTGDKSGAVIIYSVEDGWNIVNDPEGARMMSALPSMDSGILISRMGEDDLVRIDGTGHRSTVTLPAGSQPIAGIGDAVLIETSKGEPAVVPG